jgi:hypothetical protein
VEVMRRGDQLVQFEAGLMCVKLLLEWGDLFGLRWCEWGTGWARARKGEVRCTKGDLLVEDIVWITAVKRCCNGSILVVRVGFMLGVILGVVFGGGGV